MDDLIWVSLPHATFGLIIKDGRIAEAPPTARWAKGKSERFVADYFRRRGAKFKRVSVPGQTDTQGPS